MKNKTPIIIVMLFLLTACSGTSSFSDSSDIDFNQDVAVIAQGIDRFERNSQNATDMANQGGDAYADIVAENKAALDEVDLATDVFLSHINQASSRLPKEDTAESPSEAKLIADYLEKKEEEKEKQKEEKLRLKEEEKAQKEFEREKEKLNKELMHHQSILVKANESGNTKVIEEENQKIAEIQGGIDGVEQRSANIRTGYVYVISNIGSFGEEVMKIGLTRRLDPEERIQELSDASVPFKFDIHALIFHTDAVSLEKQLHQELEKLRINKVNLRKEFFKVTPSIVKELLTKLSTENILTFNEKAEAPEWRISAKQ